MYGVLPSSDSFAQGGDRVPSGLRLGRGRGRLWGCDPSGNSTLR